MPAPPAVRIAIARVGRGRVARSDAVTVIEEDDGGDADLVVPVTSGAPVNSVPVNSGAPVNGEARSRVPLVAARQTLAGSGDRLLADARDACRREGIAATRRELLMRVAKRVGLSQAEVARGLGGAMRREDLPASTGLGARRPRDPVSRLAVMILGVREREVFLARRMACPEDVAALHELAAGLGISAERVYELEASARRKLDRALG